MWKIVELHIFHTSTCGGTPSIARHWWEGSAIKTNRGSTHGGKTSIVLHWLAIYFIQVFPVRRVIQTIVSSPSQRSTRIFLISANRHFVFKQIGKVYFYCVLLETANRKEEERVHPRQTAVWLCHQWRRYLGNSFHFVRYIWSRLYLQVKFYRLMGQNNKM